MTALLEAHTYVVLVRREPRESEIAVVRAASQRLCPFQMDASRCIGVEIKPTNSRQDFFISVASREFAKAASFVVDAEFKVVTRARLDEIVDEIFRKLLLMTFCSLLAQQSLILRRHEFAPRGKTFRFGHAEQLRLVGVSLDFADH